MRRACAPRIKTTTRWTARKRILKRLAAGRPDETPYPETGFTPQRFDDPEAMFAERLEAAGGRAVVMQPSETLDEAVRRCYPEARTIVSAIPGLSVATMNPDRIEDPRELVDVGPGRRDGRIRRRRERRGVDCAEHPPQGTLLRGHGADDRHPAGCYRRNDARSRRCGPRWTTSATDVSCRARRKRPTSNRHSSSARTVRCPSRYCCADTPTPVLRRTGGSVCGPAPISLAVRAKIAIFATPGRCRACKTDRR